MLSVPNLMIDTHPLTPQAAQAMQQYSGWAPKEFDEAALNTAAAAGTLEQQQLGGARAGGGDNTWQQSQQEPQRPAPDPSTFVYDPNTGTSWLWRGTSCEAPHFFCSPGAACGAVSLC